MPAVLRIHWTFAFCLVLPAFLFPFTPRYVLPLPAPHAVDFTPHGLLFVYYVVPFARLRLRFTFFAQFTVYTVTHVVPAFVTRTFTVYLFPLRCCRYVYVTLLRYARLLPRFVLVIPHHTRLLRCLLRVCAFTRCHFACGLRLRLGYSYVTVTLRLPVLIATVGWLLLFCTFALFCYALLLVPFCCYVDCSYPVPFTLTTFLVCVLTRLFDCYFVGYVGSTVGCYGYCVCTVIWLVTRLVGLPQLFTVTVTRFVC